ncbi:hypothetical protein ACLB2K_070427 [Fragaria x ananassa]
MASKTHESGKFSLLNDDLLGLILTRIKLKDDRKSCSEVCKQWLRVEGLSHSSLVVLRPHYFLITSLARFPNLVKFETRKPLSDADLEFLAKSCPKLETVKLNWCQRDGDGGFMSLGKECPKLAGVSVFGKGRVGDSGVAALALLHCAANRLKCLCYLGSNSLISDEALEAIGSASSCSIDILELIDCRNVTDRGLRFLADGYTYLTNFERIVVAVSTIQTLKMLKLEGHWDASERTMFALTRNYNDYTLLSWEAIKAIRGPNLRYIRLKAGNISDV